MKWGLVVPLLLPYVVATLPPYKRFEPRADGISWSSCPGSSDDNIQCGYFEVPLDWAKPDSGKARLAVAKYSATNSPRKGALLSNPGGPGGSGVDHVLGYGELLNNLTGGYYDIISWDPRGVGQTTPGLINCFNSADEYVKFWNGTLVYPPIDIKYGFSDSSDLEYFNSQVDVMDARWKAFGEVCSKHESAQYLPYVGTTATVRDLVAIAEYFDGKDCDINYYGLSYGTTIGNYLINMFPKRVGRIILDGVEDPLTHASEPSHLYWARRVESVDETFQGFTQGCALSGPYGCPLATDTSTGPGIIEWTKSFLAAAHDYARSSGDDKYRSVNLVGQIHHNLYTPSTWATFASDSYSFYQEFVQVTGIDIPLATRSVWTPPELKRQSGQDWPDYTFQAISCGDSIDESDITSRAVFDELIRVVKDVSPMFGGQFPQPGHYCHRWPSRAIERFTGPWNSTLKNPIIIIGNKADPATPFLDASLVAGWLGDSATLVEQDGYGHLSLAQKSTCTQNIISNFFVNGVRPQGDDTICAIDSDGPQLFPSKGVGASDIKTAISNDGNSTTTSDSQSLDDLKAQKKNLFIAVIALAAACAMLLVSLIFSCVCGRRRREYKPIGTRGAYGQKVDFVGYDDRSSYSDPYDRDSKH